MFSSPARHALLFLFGAALQGALAWAPPAAAHLASLGSVGGSRRTQSSLTLAGSGRRTPLRAPSSLTLAASVDAAGLRPVLLCPAQFGTLHAISGAFFFLLSATAHSPSEAGGSFAEGDVLMIPVQGQHRTTQFSRPTFARGGSHSIRSHPLPRSPQNLQQSSKSSSVSV